MFRLVWILLALLPAVLAAQQPGGRGVRGRVLQLNDLGAEVPAAGAVVQQVGTDRGAVANAEGYFDFVLDTAAAPVVVARLTGQLTDTLRADAGHLHFVLGSQVQTAEVDITARGKSLRISPLETVKTEVLTVRELGKAACCNLGESFETNPSVDVSYADAATGARQLQMLGLAGQYTQILTESMPLITGLGRAYGLSYIPGPWVQSIQVSKGVGSVVQGYEAVSGQVNVTLKKPEFERLHVNAYANHLGRYEFNGLYARPVSANWATVGMLHVSDMSNDVSLGQMDRNGDGFSDQPMATQVNFANHWQYRYASGLQGEFGVQALREFRRAGQMGYIERAPELHGGNPYGIGIATERLEAFSKTGYVWPKKPYQSVGLQLAAVVHNQDGTYGIRSYNGEQRTGYGNLIYQSIIGNTNHQWRAGLSYRYDSYRERLAQLDTTGGADQVALRRDERVPGVFAEYTYTYLEQLTVMAGLRVDRNNLFGTLVTPRLHVRYAPSQITTLRLAAGRGFRAANPFADEPAVLASSRQVVFAGGGGAYPFQMEAAWNYGVNLTQQFRLWRRFGSLGLDVYRTDFERQVVYDRDVDPRLAVFRNLTGQSYAHAVQLSGDYELAKRLDIRAAYKYYDVQSVFNGQRQAQPFVPRHRVLLNAAYEVPDRWKFDATMHWYGTQRLPSTASSPEAFRRPGTAPDFAVVNAQVTRLFGKLEWYVGVENLLDFRQLDPIVSAANPFGPYFDSSLVWGPVMGRVIYTGVRFSIPQPS